MPAGQGNIFKELPHSLEVVSFPKGDELPPTSSQDVTKVMQCPNICFQGLCGWSSCPGIVCAVSASSGATEIGSESACGESVAGRHNRG